MTSLVRVAVKEHGQLPHNFSGHLRPAADIKNVWRAARKKSCPIVEAPLALHLTCLEPCLQPVEGISTSGASVLAEVAASHDGVVGVRSPRSLMPLDIASQCSLANLYRKEKPQAIAQLESGILAEVE